MRPVVLVGIVCLALAFPFGARAQASSYVPNFDPAYADLDALVAAGWLRGVLLFERPYSRGTMAGFAVEARRRLAADSVGPPRARLVEAVERLEREFEPEIAALCAAGACPEAASGVAIRSLSFDGTLANSPTRAIPSSYDFQDAHYIDADQNPLLQRNQGRVLADGETLAAELALDATLVRRIAAHAQPRLSARRDRADGGAADVKLVDGYARAVFGPLAADVGRLHVALGHGREAGPVLSHNARGLDLVRLSLERPIRLPWLLRYLGRGTVSALVADMGADVDTPHSKLIIFDGVLQPHPLLELTATLLNQQGGKGAPTARWYQRLEDIFLISPQLVNISDKVIGFGAALTVPAVRTRLYADVMSTDDHHLFRAEFREALSNEAVWIFGARATGLDRAGRLDVWGEHRVAGVRPHTHHQFTSGETQDRRVIGDALGPLGHALAGGVEWRGTAQRAGLEVDLERYSNADLYLDVRSDAPFTWVRTIDRPDERRQRALVEWALDPFRARRWGVTARVGVEHVDSFRFRDGLERFNGLAQLRVEYRPR